MLTEFDASTAKRDTMMKRHTRARKLLLSRIASTHRLDLEERHIIAQVKQFSLVCSLKRKILFPKCRTFNSNRFVTRILRRPGPAYICNNQAASMMKKKKSHDGKKHCSSQCSLGHQFLLFWHLPKRGEDPMKGTGIACNDHTSVPERHERGRNEPQEWMYFLSRAFGSICSKASS